MSRRRRSPQTEAALNYYKKEAMSKKGYAVRPDQPDTVKYEVANRLGIPMKRGYNGDMTAENAGKVGGQIGGSMVREMIRDAQKAMKPPGQ